MPPPQEFDGLLFQFQLPLLIDVEDGARAGPERAMIEEDDIRTEEKFGFEFQGIEHNEACPG
jgi:hypothetical protein